MWKPYDLEKVVDCFKNDDELESFDILEMDTILLGEIVDEGVVQELDLSEHQLQDVFLDSCMDAVTYKETCYGVPTLNCCLSLSLAMEMQQRFSAPLKLETKVLRTCQKLWSTIGMSSRERKVLPWPQNDTSKFKNNLQNR